MKLSEHKIIKTLNVLATIALVVYVIGLIAQLFTSSSPSISKAIKSYEVHNIRLEGTQDFAKPGELLKSWFKDNVVVRESNNAVVYLRFRNTHELFSMPALLFQFVYFSYWLFIGILIFNLKMFFASLRKDEIFITKNVYRINIVGFILLLLPLGRWLMQELFINCISSLKLNDSGYVLTNGALLSGTETYCGLIIIALALAFKVGVDIKQENELFV
ncbi:MAG: DUF2975 domain-containing protein [Bacteroidota bacterium]